MRLGVIDFTDQLTESQLRLYESRLNFIPIRSMIDALSSHGIDSVLAGGHAANRWRDSVRATQDVDLIVQSQDLTRAAEILESTFGLKSRYEPHVTVLHSDSQTIDLITNDQPVFKMAYESAVDEGGIKIASAEAVLVMKFVAMTGSRNPNKRDLDVADFNNICRTQTIDLAKLRALSMEARDSFDGIMSAYAAAIRET